MNHKILFVFVTIYFQLYAFEDIYAQEWNFIKEKDGIKIYTRKEGNSSLKTFKGVVDLHTELDKVYNLLGNVKNVDWWDKNLKEITVLLYEKDKHIQYYLVYSVPWPLTDRDLCVDAKITTDPVTGIRTIYSVPLLNVIPEKPDRIRITEYWQRWTIQPVTKGTVHVILEGYVDPAGSVPDWLYNMVITETPLKIIRGIKERLESQGAD
ncbi:MAG: START domain-containing protein [Bacteroidales bacterium]|jgi:hypothetical protein|nr:START domain-containing protein [Bacteroidales bacterium]